ncbi:MAG: ABC transporter ATP-binding protein [Syntrophales bacterium]|jgi:peptide/nickel transport system ATP-binding protein/oligopeptide transport system ATP-binding protein
MGMLLEIKNLSTHFTTDFGVIKAVDRVDLVIDEGDTLGVVGESGCGKTVLALSIMRLIPSPPGKIVSGNVFFNGVDLLKLDDDEMRRIRGRDISMVFQEPMTSLNPVLRIGDQITEIIRLHLGLGRKEAMGRAVEMLSLVGMPSPETIIRNYPHQMSGGMRQRVMIAMALCCGPKLMLADEPTTALDVTIQAQILELISRLKKDTGTSVILITHDLGVIAEAAEHVAVMYTGQVVEYAPVGKLFSTPLHPYTVGLMESIPRIDLAWGRDEYLKVIPGIVPSLHDLPQGCTFQDRCPHTMQICREEEPQFKEHLPKHRVHCWLYDQK